MTNIYINEKNKRDKKRKERDNYIWGIFIGNSIFFFSLLVVLITNSLIIEIIFTPILTCGIVVSILAIICPNKLNFFREKYTNFFNNVGKIILNIILTIIYFIFILPVGKIMQLRDKKDENLNTNFKEFDFTNYSNLSRKGKYNILAIFRVFATEKYALMIPILVILILVGILMAVVESTSVIPFIYTLF